MARTTFSRESTVLENPIFSIEILALGLSSVDAIVNFNSDPSLTFSTTALDLEALLEDPTNGLGTNDGLLSDISFSYTLDLSQFDLTSEQTLSGGGQSFAESRTVPEPTSSLGFIALGAVGAVSTLKRKVQSSKEKS
ncbi:PEP-CTERM sorting domain-containing protein [Hydrocoleum sp. CS-953]|uniref:PEP-CTERM sorting domain-containing protein n=3 Tax=Oscillatoriales TaxID=1150 RepID=UPI00352BCACD